MIEMETDYREILGGAMMAIMIQEQVFLEIGRLI
jgi:hypothetical protein